MIGFESIFFNYAVIAILIVYVWAMLPIVRRSFHHNSKYKWNDLLSVLLIIMICFLFVVFYLIPYPWSFFFVFFTGFWTLLTFIADKILRSRLTKNPSKFVSAETKELKRMLLHGATVIYFISALFAPLFCLLVYSIPPTLIKSEEYIDQIHHLLFSVDPYLFSIQFLIFILMGSFIIQANLEIIRLNWPNTNFVLKKTLIETMRESETGSFVSHLQFIPSLTLGTILLLFFAPSITIAVNAIFAMAMISIFGDMSAALIGTRFGKHKWPFLPQKSIEGTIGGFLVSFLSASLFIGVIMGLIGALIFVLIDIFLGNKITDNFLNPILITGTFIFFVQIPDIVYLFIEIPLIGINLLPKLIYYYESTNDLIGSVLFLIIIMFIIIIVSLLILFKYRKEEIIFLFTGKKGKK